MSAITRIGFLLVAILAQSIALAAPPPPPQYDNLYVFGDSLSDTGNDLVLTKAQRISPAIPPSESPHRTYYKGRFSNGPVAVEYFWQALRNDSKAFLTPFLSKKGIALKGAINFAFGGSTSGYVNQTPGQFYVPGVLGQVDMFRKALEKQQPPSRTLYMIWTGANDYLATPPNPPAQPTEVIANITKAVETLYSLGARDFMIPNLPDLGLAPLAGANSTGLSTLTDAHNHLLMEARDDLAARLEGVKIILVNMHEATQTMLGGNPGFAAFPPALAAVSPEPGAVDCLFRDPTTCPDVTLTIPSDTESGATKFYFWDVLHPTTSAHQALGKWMFKSLLAPAP
jgi:phospholipase/lecithinase/hemolysin